MNLREKAAQYIQDKGIPEIAKTLNVKEQTVKLWGNTGKYPIDLLELVTGESTKVEYLGMTDDRGVFHPAEKEDNPPMPNSTRTATEIHSAPMPKPNEGTWTPEDLDRLAGTMSQIVDKLQELHEWKNGMDERFNPRAVQPQPPSRTVPPASVENGEFLEANSTRPGPMAPTPHIVRGEAPPAMAPPPPQVIQPTGLNQVPQAHWLAKYPPRYGRY